VMRSPRRAGMSRSSEPRHEPT